MAQIKTERLFLRPVELNDAENIYAYRSDIMENRYQGWIPDSKDEVSDFIKSKTALAMDVADTWFQFVILAINEDKLIGDIGVHFNKTDKDQVEIGCTLDKKFRGKGYATEALTGVINYLVLTLNKQQIAASIDPRNTASIKLVERLGFKKKAHLKKSLLIRGEWVDDLIYGTTKTDWAKLQKTNGMGKSG